MKSQYHTTNWIKRELDERKKLSKFENQIESKNEHKVLKKGDQTKLNELNFMQATYERVKKLISFFSEQNWELGYFSGGWQPTRALMRKQRLNRPPKHWFVDTERECVCVCILCSISFVDSAYSCCFGGDGGIVVAAGAALKATGVRNMLCRTVLCSVRSFISRWISFFCFCWIHELDRIPWYQSFHEKRDSNIVQRVY